MWGLHQWSLLLAVPALAGGLLAMLAPAPVARRLRALPRDRLAGRLLSAAALLWAGWIVHREPLEFLLPCRRFILPAAAAAVPLAWIATPELLSCRAIGGLLALLPAPVLLAARFHPSPWRLAVVTPMYLLAVAGMWLMMSPYRLRDAIGAVTRTPARLRLAGLAAALLGLFLATLSCTAFAP
jgi:hypothetical protein